MPTSRRYEVKYAESEAAQILERAAELQRLSNDPSRMTIDELEDAAASAGIAPVHVRRAAGELTLRRARRDRDSPTIGGPRTILIEVTLEGEIPVRAYEYVIEAIRRHTGELGVASLIGRSLTWMAHPSHSQAGASRSRTIALTIVPRAGRTRIRIEEKLDLLLGAAAIDAPRPLSGRDRRAIVFSGAGLALDVDFDFERGDAHRVELLLPAPWSRSVRAIGEAVEDAAEAVGAKGARRLALAFRHISAADRDALVAYSYDVQRFELRARISGARPRS